MESATFDLYRDIAERTDGDVYLGVVGPVRTGKSTFITRLMELLVMPKIPEGARKERIADELPQSGSGRTIMTTQPQFVPSEAVTVSLSDNAPVRVRLVDSVGYMVRGALGSVDKTGSRMVHTPWYDHDIPFEQAAEVGTRKVMTDHATIGVVVTTDGTIAELPRSAYIEAENRVVSELKALGKPFVIILNSAVPNSPDAQTLRTDLQEAYGVPVMLMSVKDMQSADVQKVLESVLLEFPVRQVRLSVPKWLEALDEGHYLVQEVLTGLKKAGQETHRMRETNLLTPVFASCSELDGVQLEQLRPGEGRIDLSLTMKDGMFNRILGEECGTEIHGDKHLLRLMKELRDETGMSVLIITHNMGVVAEICDYVYVMYAGKIMEQAETFELFDHTMHPYTKGLLDSIPRIGQNAERLHTIPGVVPNLLHLSQGCPFSNRCEYATDQCRTEKAQLHPVAPDHQVRCFRCEEEHQ